MFRKDNRGVSLVELVIIMGILAVLAGVSVSMMGLLPRQRARSCSEDLEKVLESTRTTAMSFYGGYVTIEVDDSNQVYATVVTKKWLNGVESEVVGEKTKLGGRPVTLTYVLSDAATEYTLNSGDTITVSFNRASGSFEKASVRVSGTTKDDAYLATMKVSAGSTQYLLTLTRLTGAVTRQKLN